MALTGINTVPFEGRDVETCTTQGSASHKGTFSKGRQDDLCDDDISPQLPEYFAFFVPYANKANYYLNPPFQ